MAPRTMTLREKWACRPWRRLLGLLAAMAVFLAAFAVQLTRNTPAWAELVNGAYLTWVMWAAWTTAEEYDAARRNRRWPPDFPDEEDEWNR